MFWDLYLSVYVFITLFYFWYRYLLLFFSDLKKTSFNGTYDGELVSVIIPFYNEDKDALERTVRSVCEADGNTEVIVVDDGSPDEGTFKEMKKVFKGETKVRLLRYETNKGKRQAQYVGFKEARGEFIVTVDSDTMIERYAIVKLIEPMIGDPQVGATTGNVKVQNKDDNMLTKMIASRYWNAFNVERKSLSGLGIVTCCSGVLSAYRKELLEVFMPFYIRQTFLGEECTYGDDRHLTNLILKFNYKAVYVEDAVAHTLSPLTLRQFFKQQLRWKKSFIRESLISLTFAFRHSFVLPLEVLLNLIIPFLSLAVRVSVIVSMILTPVLIPYFIYSVMLVAFIRNIFLFFEDRKLAIYSIPYAFLHEFVLFWLYPVALFKLKEKGWGTR
jgi:cellulose synthase/poly-beta-1,6-N-acetylglucosamine synthase-like glycosyltransferase